MTELCTYHLRIGQEVPAERTIDGEGLCRDCLAGKSLDKSQEQHLMVDYLLEKRVLDGRKHWSDVYGNRARTRREAANARSRAGSYVRGLR